MNKISNLFLKLNPTDLIVVSFYILLILINTIFYNKIEYWYFFIFLNLCVISFVFSIAYLDSVKKIKIINIIHSWYLVFLVLLTFKELYYLNYAIHGRDYDEILIQIDRFIFGIDPTHLLHKIANPFLTEILQIIYASFYFLPIILGIDLIRTKKLNAFQFLIFSVVYGFFLSYVGYLAMPAIGPRFTLHNFHTTNIEIPGLFLTNFLRDWINLGESITPNMLNPELYVQRDVFPSGHTQMTLITMYLAIKYNSRLKIVLFIIGSLLVFSTVYLRYHYVIDVFAGFIFFVFTMISGYYLYNYWQKKTNKKMFTYKEL